ncbi:amino acid permease [Sphingopyxis panaciterrae]
MSKAMLLPQGAMMPRAGTADAAGGDGKIGALAAGFIVAGNMLGSGVYLLPATLGAIGSVTIFGWVAALAGAMILALTCSMLTVLRPDEPGLTGYISSALGRTAGYHASYIYWISVVLGNGAIALAAASYLVRLLPLHDSSTRIVAVALFLILLFTLMNVRGAKLVAKFSGATLIVGLAPVVAVATFGWFWFDPAIFAQSWNVSGHSDVSAVTLALPSIAWAFLGFESAGVAASVVRDPKRNVPLATIGGVLAAGIIYALMSAALSGLAPAADLSASSAPLADVAARLWGGWAGALIAACAAIKACGTLAGWTLVGSEMAVSAARVGLFPQFGGSARRSFLAYLAIGAVIMAGTTWLSTSPTIGEQFGLLIGSTTILCLIVYAISGVCLFALRHEIEGRLARRLSVTAAILSIAVCVLLIASCDWILILFGLCVLLSGLLVQRLITRRPRDPQFR